ncbi:MAG: OmpA family protein [Geminicoccaceae bacterium]|nr:OmpA family protein [Geminicoccaceae bacterium]
MPGPQPTAVDPARLEAQARLLLRAFPCAEVRSVASADGRLLLEGTVTGELERASLARALAALPGASSVEGGGLAIRPRPHCEAALKVAGLVGPSRLGPVRLQLNRPEGVFTAGRDVLVATLRAPADVAVWAYLDYYHENGEVYHLLPEPMAPDDRLAPGAVLRVGPEKAEAGPNDRVWEASEPYGEGRLVLLLSERPLFDRPRPIGEPAAEYLSALEAAIAAAAGLLLVAGAAAAQEKGPAFSTDELVRIRQPAVPLGRTRGFTPATGGPKSEPQPAPGTPGSGVVPDLKILFPFNSAELSAEARAQLDALGRALAAPELRPFRFRIAGHTDAVGSEAYNEGLSARRARAVVDYLEARHGIARARLAALGLGERELADPSDPASAANRRVEVRTLR